MVFANAQQFVEEPEEVTEDELQDAISEVILEAMLDGRLPCPDDVEFSHLVQVGLELGLVVDCGEEGAPDLQLSRDVELIEGLMLSQEQEEGLALEQVKQHRGTWGGTAAGL